jgi:hypothetical protein
MPGHRDATRSADVNLTRSSEVCRNKLNSLRAIFVNSVTLWWIYLRRMPHHRDTEDTEDAQRKKGSFPDIPFRAG